MMGTLAFNELLLSTVLYITPESIGVIFPFINRKSNNVNTPTLELELKRGLMCFCERGFCELFYSPVSSSNGRSVNKFAALMFVSACC